MPNTAAEIEATPNRDSTGQTPAAGKLLVTVATKLDDEMAWRWRKRAKACGMSDSQLYRLILDRADALFEAHWDPRVNPSFFIDQIQVAVEQLNLFSAPRAGNSRSRR